MSNKSIPITLHQIKASCHSCSLTQLCLPRGMAAQEVEQLDSIVRRGRPLQRTEHLYRHGDELRSLYVVKSGSFKSYTSTRDGAEQIVAFYLPGELMGFDALQHELHNCSVVALETSSVCEIGFDRFEDLCDKLPSLQRQMRRLVGREVSSEQNMLLLLGQKSAEERLATFLLNLATRFSERGFSAREFNLSMPRQDIANYLGLAVETISRLFTSFQEEGLVEVDRRRIRLADTDRLTEVASVCASFSSASNK